MAIAMRVKISTSCQSAPIPYLFVGRPRIRIISRSIYCTVSMPIAMPQPSPMNLAVCAHDAIRDIGPIVCIMRKIAHPGTNPTSPRYHCTNWGPICRNERPLPISHKDPTACITANTVYLRSCVRAHNIKKIPPGTNKYPNMVFIARLHGFVFLRII